MAADNSRLVISVFNAELVRIFDSLKTTQNLYVQIVRGESDGRQKEVARSAVCTHGNLAPRWDESFFFRPGTSTTLTLRVCVSHFLRNDVLCGEGQFDLRSLLAELRTRPRGPSCFPLYKKAEATGRLYANFEAAPVEPEVHSLSQKPGGALPPPRQFRETLQRLLHRPEELEERVRMRFRQLAHSAGAGGRQALRLEDLEPLSKLLTQKLEVPAEVFGEISQMFWRFEVTGQGLLYEDEAVRLILCMLEQYRDAISPPQGIVKLGDSIRHASVPDRYNVVKELGRGGQGIAYLATNKTSGQQVVLKTYSKKGQQQSVEEITREFELLMTLKHPKIARVFDIFQDWENIHIVQEPYFGGDLTTAINRADGAGVVVDEAWLTRVMHQVCYGVEFLHNNGVVHSDLKEANVMVADSRNWDRPQVIVIDFGLANKFCSKSACGGTPGYMPPEVWEQGLWTPRGDVFSIGVMLFVMRTGRQPFIPEGIDVNLKQVAKSTRYEHPRMQLGSLTLQALVHSMMHKRFLDRPTISQVIHDKWFESEHGVSNFDMDELTRLMHRSRKSGLYNALISDLTARQNVAQLRELNDLFVRLDVNNDGLISAQELQLALAKSWSKKDIDKLINGLGINGGGEVSYDEFMGQILAAKMTEESVLLQQIFTEVDVDRTGFLTATAMAALAKGPAMERFLGGRSAEELMRDMDLNHDGQVSFEEFRLAVQGKGRRSFSYTVGQAVQFWSKSHTTWIDSSITAIDASKNAVQVECKPNHWIQGDELRSSLRPAGEQSQGQDYRLGQSVLLWSTTFGAWLPCSVTQVDKATGAVQVDQKPNYWLRGTELRTRLRPAGAHATGRGAERAAAGRQLLAGALLEGVIVA